ncbi:MAG: repeat-containing protein YrrB [Verrucomicrobiales bacterium]|nr:repeat-containing protein YrrB [Verrucomicrobiales bacterium]
MESKQKRDSLFVCLFLVVATLAVYLQVTGFDFVNYDDPEYVSENPRIQQGFSGETIRWAFTTLNSGNWHPLTWLSHVLDWEIFGANAGGHHFSSVLIHIASTLLLFFSLRLMTGAVWRSGFVAALFALHPLHVESVAWISERKDVLSAFFWMLTMLFYARYVRERRSSERVGRAAVWNYAFGVTSFCVGLLAKQMLVTLPFALLLLDLWPLQRLQTFALKPFLKLVVEKIPFFVITAIFIPIAIWAQKASNAIVSVDLIPLDQRFENALVAYLRYFWKMIWPAKLAVFYAYPDIFPLTLFICAVIFVLAGFAISVRLFQRKKPLFFVGWCWFIGTLVPVIGVMQIGSQSMADRYSYIPLIGLFIIGAWGAYDSLNRVLPKFVLISGSVLSIIACMAMSVTQLQYWKDSLHLFKHALAVTEKSKVAYINLGDALLSVGDTNAATENFTAALKISPGDAIAHANLAGISVAEEKWEDAESHYEAALQADPSNAALHNAIGLALARQNKLEDAIQHYHTSLQINPDFYKAAYNLGNAYSRQHKPDEAIAAYERALSLNPQEPNGHYNVGSVLISRERYREAEAHLREAVRLRPDFADAHHNLGVACLAEQKADPAGQHVEEAVLHFRESIRLNTNDAVAHCELGNIASSRHDTTNAIFEYRAALQIQPDLREALNNLAWILATSADSKLRNGDEAVQLAERACNLVKFNTPIFIGTLAAAYAEAGNFPKAIEMGEAAYQLATSVGQIQVAEKNLELLKFYRARHPYWEAGANGTK